MHSQIGDVVVVQLSTAVVCLGEDRLIAPWGVQMMVELRVVPHTDEAVVGQEVVRDPSIALVHLSVEELVRALVAHIFVLVLLAHAPHLIGADVMINQQG